MKVELCIWQAIPGGVPLALGALRNAAPARRGGGSLAGVWTSDSGELNQIIHLWRHEDDVHDEDMLWPRECTSALSATRSEFLVPAPFSPPLLPKALGAIYEFRFYTLPTEAVPDLVRRWAHVIEWRSGLSPLVGAWLSQRGPTTSFVHLWAYKDANDWQRIRGEAKQSGKWPPVTSGTPSVMTSQRSILALPAGFSPLH